MFKGTEMSRSAHCEVEDFFKYPRVERAGGSGAGREPYSLHAQRVWFALETHHISCLFIKKMVRITGCVELARPQTKITFMCYD